MFVSCFIICVNNELQLMFDDVILPRTKLVLSRPRTSHTLTIIQRGPTNCTRTQNVPDNSAKTTRLTTGYFPTGITPLSITHITEIQSLLNIFGLTMDMISARLFLLIKFSTAQIASLVRYHDNDLHRTYSYYMLIYHYMNTGRLYVTK
jgi:hypothetical protein